MSSETQQIYEELSVGCHAYREGFKSSYDYIPSKGAGIAFCLLFGITMIAHIVQFSWKRTWWCCVFAIGSAVEVLGWAGRTWSSDCPYNSTAFMIQISTLIIAPVFYTAGIYILLGRLIKVFGPESSFLSPKLYLWIFCTCDVISLVIQAAGGGLASSASNGKGDTKPGTNTMVAGIVFQLVSISVFVYCAIDFLRRTTRAGLIKMGKMDSTNCIVLAMIISVVFIYIRSIYRVVELAQGWTGYIITHEVFFIALDGVMMIVAVGIFNIFHPGWLLPSYDSFTLPKYQSSREMTTQKLQSPESSENRGPGSY